MALSTSHSNKIPRLALGLLATATCTWLLAAFYTVRLNPEVALFHAAHTAKLSHAATLPPGSPKFVVAGGSGVHTSVIPTRLRELHSILAVNAGLGAGMGAETLLAYASQFLQPNDTLIIALEPTLLHAATEPTPLAAQFAFATGQSWLALDSPTLSYTEALLMLRPGGYHALTLMGKILLRKPLYRYAPSEIHSDGWHEVAVRREVQNFLSEPLSLSSAAHRLLRQIATACASRNIRVAYSLPFMFAEPGQIPQFQTALANFLLDVQQDLPVLRDPTFGLHSNPDHFADTMFHPNAVGAEIRTDHLATQLTEWVLWTRPELEAFASLPNPAEIPPTVISP